MFTRRAELDRSTGQTNGAAGADASAASDREALRYAREIAALYPADGRFVNWSQISKSAVATSKARYFCRLAPDKLNREREVRNWH